MCSSDLFPSHDSMKAIGGKLQAGDDAVDVKFFPLNNLPVIAFDAHRDFIAKETKL